MLTACVKGEVGDVPADRAGALPPAKAALAGSIAAVNRAQEELEEAQKPVDKLAHARAGAALHEAADLRGEIARLRAAHEAEINAWVDAGGDGERPPPPAELVPLERALGSIAAVAREAGIRFPRAQSDIVSAAQRVRNSMIEREQATWPAAIEAADRAVRELQQTLTAAQAAEGRLLSLVFALRDSGARAGDNGNGALAAAAKVEERIIATKRCAAPRVDPAHGRSLIERLRLDPHAEL